MESKEVRKMLKKYFSDFAKQNRFIFHRSTLLIKIQNETLHIIDFPMSRSGLVCNVAIQPLYIPREVICLNFGNRLNYFKTVMSGNWCRSNNIDDCERDIKLIYDLIEKNVLPWFNEFGTPQGIIDFVEKGFVKDRSILQAYSPFEQKRHLAFSYLRTNKIDLAIKPLQEIIDVKKDDDRDWGIREYEMLKNLLDLAENHPEKVSDKLDEFSKTTLEKINANYKLKLEKTTKQ